MESSQPLGSAEPGTSRYRFVRSIDSEQAAPQLAAMAGADAWPGGLNDQDAALRLQTVAVQAAEGNRDVSNDRDYKSLRKPLIRRGDLSDVVPPFIRAHRDLAAFSAYLRQFPDVQTRRAHVWEHFKPLLDRIEGKTRPPIRSSAWTGRRTAAQQAQVVLSLAPDALYAAQLLLSEQEQSLANGGPVDAERAEAIAALRELHSELGTLIGLAESGMPLATQLGKVRRLKDRALKWSISPYGLALGNLPLAGSSAVVGCGLFYLVNIVTKDATAAAGVSAAAATVFGTRGVSDRKAKDREPR